MVVMRLVLGVVVVAIASVLMLFAPAAIAHPGGLNSSGCHNNRKTGDYHCHRAHAPPPSVAPVRSSPPAPARSAPAKANSSRLAPTKRSASAKAAFRRANPCPATGKTTGTCPGWEVDHIKPLACGGPDAPDNMQWLTAKENRRKGSMGCRRP